MCGVANQDSPSSVPFPAGGQGIDRIELDIWRNINDLLDKWNGDILRPLLDLLLDFIGLLSIGGPSISILGSGFMGVEPIHMLSRFIVESRSK